MPVDPRIITAFLPLCLLLIDKEEDRQQIARLYLEYSRLMHLNFDLLLKTAQGV